MTTLDIERFIQTEIYCTINHLAEEQFKSGKWDISEAENIDYLYREEREIAQYWLISNYAADRLTESGAPVLEIEDGFLWLRTEYGSGLDSDFDIQCACGHEERETAPETECPECGNILEFDYQWYSSHKKAHVACYKCPECEEEFDFINGENHIN